MNYNKNAIASQRVAILEEHKGVAVQVYNLRSGIVEFSLHKGTANFLLNERNGQIDILNKIQAIKMLERLQEVVENSNFKAFRVVDEDTLQPIYQPNFTHWN